MSSTQGAIFQTSEYFKSISVLSSLHFNPEFPNQCQSKGSLARRVTMSVSVSWTCYVLQQLTMMRSGKQGPPLHAVSNVDVAQD